MNTRHSPRRGAAAVLTGALIATASAVGLVPDAAAQSHYRCSGPGGGTYWSDRPCPAGRMGQLGGESAPARTPAYSAARTAPMGEVPAHQNYLPATCADLSEAIRTAPARGVGRDTVAGLRREWQDKCERADSQARKQLAQERREASARADAAEAANRRSAQERQQEADRCALLRKNLANRRQRTDLTPGEQADLLRFEATYRERCPG